MSYKREWETKEFNLTLTGSQANKILTVLLDEANDDRDAYWDFSSALAKAGFWAIEEGK